MITFCKKSLKLFLTLILFFIYSNSVYSASSWSYEAPDSTLMYNTFNNSWDYEAPDSTLMSNSFLD